MSRVVRKALLSGLLLTQFAIVAADKTGRTFFIPRSQTYNMPLQHSSWCSLSNQENPGFGGNLQAAPFFQQSADRDGLGKYFGLNGKRSMTIGAANADIHPYNFNLDTGYQGSIEFAPETLTYGVRFDYHQDINHLLEGLYFSVGAPVARVENNMHLRVTGGNNSDWWNTVQSVFAGGRLSSDWSEPWKYAKITNTKGVTGLADLDCALGYKLIARDRFRLALQANVIVPTGNKPRAEYLFEPVVGNAFHWGLGAGLNSRLNVWQHDDTEDKRFSLWLHARVDYLFENDETRTLTLKNKPLGHFIRMRQLDPQDPTRMLPNSEPGVDVMTRRVDVTPGVQFEALLQGDFTFNAWKFGVGYNLWAREGEHVKLKGNWNDAGRFGLIAQTRPVIDGTARGADGIFIFAGANADTLAIDGGAPFNSNPALRMPAFVEANQIAAPSFGGISSATSISAYGVADGVFIQQADVDMAGHPAALSHRVVGSVSYALSTDNPSFVGLGGSYEFGASNTAVDMWSLWLKYGISF